MPELQSPDWALGKPLRSPFRSVLVAEPLVQIGKG
jgi:hypothetical protein